MNWIVIFLIAQPITDSVWSLEPITDAVWSTLTRTVKWTLFTGPISLIIAFFASWILMDF